MSGKAKDMHGNAIRRALLNASGGGRDASAVAQATVDILALVAVRLAPLIGSMGATVLFGRALHLTAKTYPWLTHVENSLDNPDDNPHDNPAESTVAFPDIKARLESQEASIAADAGGALLLTFTELLASLIGESLTEGLLSPVWESQDASIQKDADHGQ